MASIPPPICVDSGAFSDSRPPGGLWRLLAWWHLTSLDAPTVAIAWCLAFAWVAHLRLPSWLPVVLGLATWVFYVADRLLDARAFPLMESASTCASGTPFPSPSSKHHRRAFAGLKQRHRFHWQHRRLFLPIAIAAAVIALALVLHFMPLAARARNSVLAAAAFAYLTSVHSPWRLKFPGFRLPKELLVGIIFTFACAIPTWARADTGRVQLISPILCFVALAWLNCHAIESWEAEPQSRPAAIFRPAVLLAGAAFCCAIIAECRHHPRPAALLGAAALSAAVLAILDGRRRSLAAITLRAAADLALLTPLSLLAMP